MSSRRRVSKPAAATTAAAARRPAVDEGGPTEPKRVSAPEPCGFIEALSATFDSSRVLLRLLFFLNADRTKYVSVGFYPARNYEPCVEFGGAKQKPVIIAQQHVTMLANRLLDIVHSVCDAEQFTYSDGLFRINSTGSYKVTRLNFDKAYVYFKQAELQSLYHIFYVLQSQLSYMLALPDVLTYATNALASTTYFPPHADTTDYVLWYQLFDELKMPL